MGELGNSRDKNAKSSYMPPGYADMGDDFGFPSAAHGAGLSELTGRQIGRYLVGERLGSGGAATVYRAYDQVQGQTVALKVLLPSADEKSLSRFQREAATAGGLRHPNVVRVLQVGVAPRGEVAYIAMELIEGESLADLLGRVGTLSQGDAAALLAPIARALDHAHRSGIVHRDVKPSNILLKPVRRDAAGALQVEALEYPVVPLLTDFGIARSLDAPELTSAGRTVGTPAYMAPEQASGSREIDGRADIYALGTVLYRALAGRLPYAGSATQILHAHVYDALMIDSTLLAQLRPEMVTVLRRSLAKNPADRYATAAPMAQTLGVIAAQELASAHTATFRESEPAITATQNPVTVNPNKPRREAANPTLGATGTAVLVPGVAGDGPPNSGAPGGPGGGDGDGGGNGRRKGIIWASLAALLVLAVGLVYGIVTFVDRDPNDPGNVAIIPTGLPPTVTPSNTPGGTPATPSGDQALMTLADVTATNTATPTPRLFATPLPVNTPFPTFVLPNTPAVTVIAPPWTPEVTATPSQTPTDTSNPGPTPTNARDDEGDRPATATHTWTPLPVLTNTPTWTPAPATSTPTPTWTQVAAISTPTPTWTEVAATSTPPPTPTATVEATSTPTPSPTATEEATATPTPSPTETEEATPTATPTRTQTPTRTATPTPTPTEEETPEETPIGEDTPQVTPEGDDDDETEEPTATQEATATVDATATIDGTLEGTPTVEPTETITTTLTPTTTLTVTPTGTITVTVTPTASLESTLPDGVVGDCSIEVDETLIAWMAQLEGEDAELFECAVAPAQERGAMLLAFEQGYMALVDDEEQVAVYLLDDGSTEFYPVTGGPPSTDEAGEAPDGLFAPEGILGEVWRREGLVDSLGWALEEEPIEFVVIVQEFPGGTLYGEPESGIVFQGP